MFGFALREGNLVRMGPPLEGKTKRPFRRLRRLFFLYRLCMD
jgi:hypothetical protein